MPATAKSQNATSSGCIRITIEADPADVRDIADLLLDRAVVIGAGLTGKRKNWPGAAGVRARSLRFRSYANTVLDQVPDERHP